MVGCGCIGRAVVTGKHSTGTSLTIGIGRNSKVASDDHDDHDNVDYDYSDDDDD